MNKLSKGFSLVELMVIVGLIGILSSLAIPSMQEFVKSERMTSELNLLISHLFLARSEAVRRNQSVVLCTSSNGSSCTGTSAENGWLIFVDDNNDEVVSGGEDIIAIKQALQDSDITISTLNKVVFDNRGFSPDSAGTFNFCDDRGSDSARVLSISKTGRIHRRGTASC